MPASLSLETFARTVEVGKVRRSRQANSSFWNADSGPTPVARSDIVDDCGARVDFRGGMV